MSIVPTLPPDLKKTFNCQLTMFKIVGLDFLQDPNANFVKRYGKIIIFDILFLLLLVLTNLFSILGSKIDASFVDIANALPCALMFTQDFIMFHIIILKRQRIRQVLLDIGEVWPDNIRSNKEKAQMMKRWMNRRTFFESLYLGAALLSSTVFLLTPISFGLYNIITKGHTDIKSFDSYPFNMYCPFEVNSYLSYLMVYCFQITISMILHYCINVSFILLLGTVLYDISFLLRLVQFDLEHVLQPSKNSRYNSEDMFNSIKSIIKMHQTLLGMVKNVNDVFGLLLVIPTCLSSVIICFFAFLAVTVDVKWNVGTIGVILAIFNMTWPGQLLEDTSLGVADAAYQSLWYESDIKLQKCILLIIVRSQQKAYLSALGYVDMNLKTFSKIVSTSWSYFSLLTQVYNTEI